MASSKRRNNKSSIGRCRRGFKLTRWRVAYTGSPRGLVCTVQLNTIAAQGTVCWPRRAVAPSIIARRKCSFFGWLAWKWLLGGDGSAPGGLTCGPWERSARRASSHAWSDACTWFWTDSCSLRGPLWHAVVPSFILIDHWRDELLTTALSQLYDNQPLFKVIVGVIQAFWHFYWKLFIWRVLGLTVLWVMYF